MSDPEERSYEDLGNRGTGSHYSPEDYRIIIYPFDKYEIAVKVTPSNEFLGIEEVKVNKSYLSHKQRITGMGYHEVEEYYRE